jgi:hypothetical protein
MRNTRRAPLLLAIARRLAERISMLIGNISTGPISQTLSDAWANNHSAAPCPGV